MVIASRTTFWVKREESPEGGENRQQEGGFEGASWQGGQSMVSPQGQVSSQPGLLDSNQQVPFPGQHESLAFLVTPDRGPSLPPQPPCLPPAPGSRLQSLWRFPALVHLVPSCLGPPNLAPALASIESRQHRKSILFPSACPSGPSRSLILNVSGRVLAVSMFTPSFRRVLTASPCHSPPLAAPQMLSGSCEGRALVRLEEGRRKGGDQGDRDSIGSGGYSTGAGLAADTSSSDY